MSTTDQQLEAELQTAKADAARAAETLERVLTRLLDELHKAVRDRDSAWERYKTAPAGSARAMNSAASLSRAECHVRALRTACKVALIACHEEFAERVLEHAAVTGEVRIMVEASL